MRTTAMLARACDGESCMSESSTPTSNAGTTTPRERRHRKTKRLERATTDERPGDRPRGLPRDPRGGSRRALPRQGRRRPPRSGGAVVRLGDRADGRMADLHRSPTRCRTSTRRRIGSGSTASSPLPRASRSPISRQCPAPSRSPTSTASPGGPCRTSAGQASGSPTCSASVGADKSACVGAHGSCRPRCRTRTR